MSSQAGGTGSTNSRFSLTVMPCICCTSPAALHSRPLSDKWEPALTMRVQLTQGNAAFTQDMQHRCSAGTNEADSNSSSEFRAAKMRMAAGSSRTDAHCSAKGAPLMDTSSKPVKIGHPTMAVCRRAVNGRYIPSPDLTTVMQKAAAHTHPTACP